MMMTCDNGPGQCHHHDTMIPGTGHDTGMSYDNWSLSTIVSGDQCPPDLGTAVVSV